MGFGWAGRHANSLPTALDAVTIGPMVPFGDQKGTRCRLKAEAVAAPATVSGKTTPPMITGQLGRSASVVDPRARRPAIARAADLGRGDR